MAPQHVKEVGSIIRDYAMREDGDESGAAEHRYVEKRIDPSKGTAAGYIAKYISKNIDGYGLVVRVNYLGRSASIILAGEARELNSTFSSVAA